MTPTLCVTPSFKDALEQLRPLIAEHFPEPLTAKWVGDDGHGGLVFLMRLEISVIEEVGRARDRRAQR